MLILTKGISMIERVSQLIDGLLAQIDFTSIFKIILTIIISAAAYYFITKIITTAARGVKVQKERVDAVTNVIKTLLVVLAFISILGALKIDVTGLVAGIGIGAIAIGFAAQTLISNIISGLFLFFEGVFNLGDYIQVSDTVGRVTKMSFRTTQLETIDGNIVTLPNSLLATNQVTNLTGGKKEILLTIKEKIDIFTDLNMAKQLMLDALIEVKGVIIDRSHKPIITVDREPEQWSTNLTLFVSVKSNDWYITQSTIKENIKVKFENAQIIPPVPAIARIRLEEIKKELQKHNSNSNKRL
jgi:small-conductance mechanosensitive channel